MATLLLTAAGAALGGTFGAVGATIGQAVGGLLGAAVDRALFGERRTIGRLADLEVQSSTEGAPIPRIYGRMRLAGEVIWATRFVETSESGGGKGGAPTRYRYAANFAVGLCEGPIAHVGRVWANGRLLDTAHVVMRVHKGGEGQQPDSLILAKQGENAAPAYRGLAYVVFEGLPLDKFGNALPQLAFEVIRPVGRLEPMIRAVTLIPGSTEFGYHTEEVRREPEEGVSVAENRHAAHADTDVLAALDELQAVCPNLEAVAVVVAWFGDDLRAGSCRLRPKVEGSDRKTTRAWRVSGLTRATAETVSRPGGAVAYGGTPADASVVALIRELSRRGLRVSLYPFVLMDVPPGNGLPDPEGAAEQPAFPWRGRITCHPAPGRPGSPDGTAAATAAIDAFVGSATAAALVPDAEDRTVGWSGPAEWSLRRMILHYARLAALAGGVDTFLIGSELRGLTTVRGPARSYPFVDRLVTLAADVRAILGPSTAIGYAADWSEYFGHHPAHVPGDVSFHLDPLWASPAIDFVGIDAYFPLADWRDGEHADRAVAAGPYDRDHLASNVAGGELFDWYYANTAARRIGQRTPINDGAAGKPWVFRPKDLAGWWGNRHVDRIGGVEVATPTAWLVGMKPIRFTEVGCPAIEYGANQPNVFVDPRSSESLAPHFSRGGRDDAAQRSYLEAFLGHFDPAVGGAAANPLSPRDGRRMVDLANAHVWTYDARPYPWFPLATDVWSDGPNWATGHWLNGRLGAAPLAETIERLAADAGCGPVDASGLSAVVDGVAITDRTSPRAVVEPLAEAFRFTVAEAGGTLRIRDRDGRAADRITRADLVDAEGEPLWTVRRDEDEVLPTEVTLGFLDSAADGLAGAATARRPGKANALDLGLPIAADPGVMAGVADALLKDRLVGRRHVTLALAPTRLAVEAGDTLTLDLDGAPAEILVERIEDGPVRRIEGRAVEPGPAARPRPRPGRRSTAMVPPTGRPAVLALDLPVLDGVAETAHHPHLAVRAIPWPRALAVHLDRGGFEEVAEIATASTWGRTLDALPAGPVWRWDRASSLTVALPFGRLASVSDEALFAGRNRAAVGTAAEGFEILQFGEAVLVGEGTYRLARLLRGLAGTEARSAAPLPAGAQFVLLDGRVGRLPIDRDLIGAALAVRVGPADRSIGDPSMTDLVVRPGGVGLLPLAPVHLDGRRGASGDVDLRWIRRTRIGGDDFQAVNVPLAEASERYRVTIFAGGEAVRTMETATPSVLYPAADQIADHGTLPAAIDWAVAQISEAVGPGLATRSLLHV